MDHSFPFLSPGFRFQKAFAAGKLIPLRVPVTVATSVSIEPVLRGEGRLLRDARLRLGYTQQMLADFMQVGLTTVKRAESGESLRSSTIALICGYFSDRYGRLVTPDELGLTFQRVV